MFKRLDSDTIVMAAFFALAAALIGFAVWVGLNSETSTATGSESGASCEYKYGYGYGWEFNPATGKSEYKYGYGYKLICD